MDEDVNTREETLRKSTLNRGLNYRFRLFGIIALGLVVFLTGVILVWQFSNHKAQNGLPASITHEISSFHVYYFKDGYSTDFKLQQNSVSYVSGVLVFNMRNPVGKTLAFTEQPTPPEFDTSTLQTTKQFSDEFGQGFITDESQRTTGALFTQDKTWIIINAPNPIGADTMQQILEALQPISL